MDSFIRNRIEPWMNEPFDQETQKEVRQSSADKPSQTRGCFFL